MLKRNRGQRAEQKDRAKEQDAKHNIYTPCQTSQWSDWMELVWVNGAMTNGSVMAPHMGNGQQYIKLY